MKKLLLPLLGIIPLLSLAGGFQVNLQGTKQTGMGHLGTSFHLGASSTYFNPAMMGLDTNRFGIELGVNFITSNIEFQNSLNGISETTENPTGTPFYLYATYKINDKLTAGLGVYTPFGSSVDWGEDWSGKHLIQDISLRAIFIQPTLSYSINDKLSFGAGLTIVDGAFEINRALPVPIGNNATANLEGSAIAFGFNAGLHFQATEQLSIGLTHRSKVEIELEGGDVDFTTDAALASSFPDGKFDATLPLPATTTLGIAYKVNEKLLVSIEGSFVEWSAYKSLDFDFETETASLKDSKNPRNYEDAMIFRAGAQYSYNEMLDFRAGFYYDQSPIQDEYFNPETPNSDNIGLTAGLSGHITERFGFDASFLYIIGQERDSEYKPAGFGGKYASRSVITGIGFNYSF
ncbi:MAG: outer membrane protein transport protein [Flavobacteriales bacterium]|nr:outer membrane protein transport protein [Flavobacteriales bacterium]